MAGADLDTGCCPPFDPSPWEDREIVWEDKLFAKDEVRSFLHIPLNFGGVMKKNVARIEAAEAKDEDMMVLCDYSSPWRTEVYISVKGEVPGAEAARLSGTYRAWVFEGPYKDAGKWAVAMTEHVRAAGKEPQRLLYWHTTCPKCAKVYGKNYTVMLAQV